MDGRLDLARVDAGVVVDAVDRAENVAAALLLHRDAALRDGLQIAQLAEDVVGVVLDSAGDVIRALAGAESAFIEPQQ